MELNLARMTESRRELERALGIFHELGDTRGGARALDILAMTDGVTARLERAIDARPRGAGTASRSSGDRSTCPR